LPIRSEFSAIWDSTLFSSVCGEIMSLTGASGQNRPALKPENMTYGRNGYGFGSSTR
jgi:hypothetical protein